ncbi:MAG: cob(I)yrinic acid a,c-diamide adenosyltransferase [Aquificae bacterium]|nr:cob(I)yrinic acid a,c-diamide adenosyltransferase [Aquificota bacterium]
MVYVYTGDGKGKTTAAIGTGIRAVGSGLSVLMVQFMKVKELTSEYRVLQKIDRFEVVSFGREGFYLPAEEIEKNPELAEKGFKPFSKIDYQLADEGIEYVKNSLLQEKHDLYILDEVCIALHYGLLKEKTVVSMLTEHGKEVEFILTGRNCPKAVLETADLITEMKNVRHPFEKGIMGRKGIDR